ncbi:AAA family ATPase [Haliangium sp.]|uniref:AAA family ATPase n=1 Tax=Haliangium sp. TaxID=2663208 RepID=UPI003D0D2291
MLQRVALREIKTHRDTEIALGRLTVLVGPNGAGKSSVLRAIDAVHRLTDETWNQVFRGPMAWPALHRRQSMEEVSFIHISGHTGPATTPDLPGGPGTSDADAWEVELQVRGAHSAGSGKPYGSGPYGSGPYGGTHSVDRTAQVDWILAEQSHEQNLQFPGDDAAIPLQGMRTTLGSALLLRPDPHELAAPAYTGSLTPQLGPTGEGLAEVVADMLLGEPSLAEEFQRALSAVVPEIERVRVRRAPVRQARTRILRVDDTQVPMSEEEVLVGSELVFDVAGAKGIPAHAMSDGSLVALAILALLWSPVRPQLALLDGLEHALHPKAQWALLAQLRRLLEQRPELQIIATTHSPDLADELTAEEVVVMALDRDGVTHARPLTECPRSDMLGILRAGELWSALGEDWVAEDGS